METWAKLIRTYGQRRPDLIEKYPLTNADKQILERYKIGLKKVSIVLT